MTEQGDGRIEEGEDGRWWVLRPEEHAPVASKYAGTRGDFALLLTFFRAHGRFPRTPAEVDARAPASLAVQIGDAPRDPAATLAGGRTLERHRAEIRAHFGFREATVDDGARLTEWLRVQVVPESRDRRRLAAALDAECRRSRVEPPTPERTDRLVRAAVHAHEDALYARTHERLTSDARAALDALLHPPLPSADGGTVAAEAAPAPADPDGAPEVGTAAVGPAAAALATLRTDPGRASLASVRDELAKLAAIRAVALPAGLFAEVGRHELALYRQRVAVEAPYELRRHPDAARRTWLAAYAHLRGRELTDGLVDLLIETVHAIGARAERTVERELLDDLKRVTGKQSLLFQVADAALAHPDGTVRAVVFPVVAEGTLRDLVREWKATGPTYRTTLRTVIRTAYRAHYRRVVPELLAALDFHSNNTAYQPLIEALALVRRYADTALHTFPADEEVPLDGVVPALWRDAVVEEDHRGRPRVNRLTYELCVLETLREQLRCKELWVAGADRYRNPDADLPTDFAERRVAYYGALALPLDAEHFTGALRGEMHAALGALDAGLPRNAGVRVGAKGGGWITVTPLDAQPEPENLGALKAAVAAAWPMTGLLDMLKEADLRLGFTDALRSASSYESLDRAVLRPRLLLCLHGLGTNAGLQRMAAAQPGTTVKDLLYVRRRYLSVEQLRRAIAVVADGTLAARDSALWGEGTTACASDSKHFGAWDQNLTTQWHVRYGGRGVMIYWHVERKSLCIHSQLKAPSSSEVASMIEGVLRHCTAMSVDRQYVDSHGQSEVAFAFCRLLGFQLLPRLKAIHSQRLYRPEAGQPDAYPRLAPVLSRPIDWELIRRQYDEMVKYATALRLGTAETEAILRRFTRANVQHPTYRALAELGKAVKTVFLARYLHDQQLRREIHEGLNVIEQWNGATDFVFFARRGELASNRREDHEVSMLALHLCRTAWCTSTRSCSSRCSRGPSGGGGSQTSTAAGSRRSSGST